MFDIGDRVKIKSSGNVGYVCDVTDRDAGRYIVDCHDTIGSDDPVIYLVDTDENDLTKVNV